MDSPSPCRVLMVYPRFISDSFWNFREACELVGAKYPAAPLGLITVAALLPRNWDIRLVNRNTEELSEADLTWCDLVMTGGMLNQQPDTLDLIDLAHRYGKPVAVGGPDPTSSPHIYEDADFRVLGEAEGIIGDFLSAWERGERRGDFTAPKFQVDVTGSPVPRFDLLKFDQYLYIGVQYSRGCPFTCEFCDIIELYGRVPRAKTVPQMLAELDALYERGYRGHVDFVDDNLIGNKKALKLFLPALREWQKARSFPFELSTEASINLSDDDELLALMQAANFFAVFVGIESPDPVTLAATKKKQNTRRDLASSIHKIYSAGMFVTAGFIIGFDTEKVSMADAMADFIEEAAIPVSMVGLLYALPNTQLTRRLEQEGRLHPGHDVMPREDGGDQCTRGMNFDTLRPLRDILADYRSVLERIYDPEAYASRIRRLVSMLDRSGRPRELPQGDVRRDVGTAEALQKIFARMPHLRETFWSTFIHCAKTNPSATRYAVFLMAMFLHLGPYSRYVIQNLDKRLAALDAGAERASPEQAPIRAT
ncbi:MAG TPA: B12-binding domain-containing radical SAM protein [Pseudorhodoplanes sp.]|nr:B12-binding domain-containing radical SAM protein [Pseudorhodoplanes sp.]